MTKRSCVLATIFVSAAAVAASSQPFDARAATPDDPRTEQTAQSPDTQAPIDLNIPAQSLDSALTAFADQAGLRLLFASKNLAGRRTEGLTATLTPDEALKRLLAGTGMTWRFTDDKTVVLENPAGGGTMSLDPITVEGKAVPQQAEIGNLPPPYAGGQVATGGKLGILGNRDLMDTPFNQTSYTAKLLQDQQSHFFADSLKNDPSVRVDAPVSSGLDNFSIRGFDVSNQDVLFGGLAGVAPTFFNSMMSESIERVEVLKGPNALLNGAAPSGGVGGTINIVPKRANDTPLTQVSGNYVSELQFGVHADVGRRFGPANEFGVRFNGAFRKGDTPVDNQSRESRLAALGLDYRGDGIRISSDMGYQYQDVEGTRRFSTVATGVTVPDVPDNRHNFYNPWEFSAPEVFYGAVRGEVDVTADITAFATAGGSQRRTQYISSNRTIVNDLGDLSAATESIAADKMYSLAYEAGLLGTFDTGPINHQATATYSRSFRDWRRTRISFAIPASNIYTPTFGPEPSSSLLPDPDDTPKLNELTLSSATLGDTLSVLNGQIQLTGGFRFQRIESKSYLLNVGTFTSSYNESAATPMGGLLVKPWRNVSLYTNYIEGLQQGQVAPVGTTNEGEVFPPYVTKQYEVGAKVDFGRIAVTLDGFQIAQPSGLIDPGTNTFTVDGEQRHRGVELNVFGEAIDGVRLLSGVTYIDSNLSGTANGVNDGNSGVGVPEFRLVFGAEWDTPFLRGLTATGRVSYNSSAYLDAANTQKVPSYTQLDLGARYKFELPKDTPVTVRANVYNVLDSSHWISNGFGQLAQNDPLTFILSATVDF